MWGRWKFPAGCPPSPQAAGAPWGWDTPNGVIMSPVPCGDRGHLGVQPSCSSSVSSVRRAGRSPRAASRGGIQGCCCICPHPWARSWCPHPKHSPQRAGTWCIHAASPRRAAAKGHGPRCPLPKPLPQKDACLHCDPFKGCPPRAPFSPSGGCHPRQHPARELPRVPGTSPNPWPASAWGNPTGFWGGVGLSLCPPPCSGVGCGWLGGRVLLLGGLLCTLGGRRC